MTTPSGADSLPPGMLVTGGTAQVQLWKALDKHESLYEFMHELGRVGRALDSDGVLQSKNFAVNKTAKAFRDAAGGKWDMMAVLHSMPRSMVRAIVLGTVAFDDYGRGLESYTWPSTTSHTDRQGVYVIGLRRVGHDGRFLTAGEAKLLIDGLNQYTAAARRALWPVTGPATERQHAAAQLMARVDARVAGKGNWQIVSPRFITSEENMEHVRALVGSLRRVVGQMEAVGMDAGERMAQSPLYVGCSTNLLARLADYELSQDFRSVNNKLAVTTSMLLELDLPVELVARMAVRTWMPTQLAVAEHLVVTMASSLVYQGGFNATQAGERHGTWSGCDDARQLVLGRTPYLRDNLACTLGDIADRARFETELNAFLEDLDKSEADMLDAEVEAAAAAPYLHVDCDVLIQSLEARVAQVKIALKEAQEDYETAQVLARLARISLHGARGSTAPADAPADAHET
ncbi:hypothetical protein JDV02_008888 [Purpureocillium takamizusanense]|uniref:Uncharacterized protein n=1 Tax=Purpureocillium takamizusanense TaxID=2060973 RepID=A0A9Q8VDQ6_9HYPO|nr:uncharacterized protein JDV02_008888 [Purpureocillium takamizusanense]UNI23045.1 hypothetical protein JDV02_008888 [Purpureocillium takamizusanense]